MLGAQGIRATGFKRAQGNAHCAKFESNTNILGRFVMGDFTLGGLIWPDYLTGDFTLGGLIQLD